MMRMLKQASGVTAIDCLSGSFLRCKNLARKVSNKPTLNRPSMLVVRNNDPFVGVVLKPPPVALFPEYFDVLARNAFLRRSAKNVDASRHERDFT